VITHDAMADLEAWRSRYSNRRTIAYAMLDEVYALANEAIALAEAKAEARADGRIAELERQREREQSYLETYRTRVRQLEDEVAEKRRLREEREQSGDEVQVHIGRSLGGSWLVSDLEEIAYRLRCGGATDDTPVKVTEYTATAKVVAPELVPLSRPSERPALMPAPLPDHVRFVARRLAALMGAAFVLGVLVVLLGLVVL